MRKKIKKINKSTALTNNEFGIILEEINSNLKLVLEDHTGLDKKIDNLREEMNSRFQEVDKRFNGVDQRFDGIDGRLMR